MAEVSLLDVDADLADVVPEQDRAAAAPYTTAQVERLPVGPWDAPREPVPGCFAMIVLSGLISRNVLFGGTVSRELLGTGDLLRPWDVDDNLQPVVPTASWTVLEPAEVAPLRRDLMRLGARWPGLVEELIHRVLHRSRWLAVRLAVTGTTRVDQRLLYFFWHAAARWGRVTPEGTLVPFKLTHELLADLVGARRPSVSTAIKELQQQGRLDRVSNGWLLKGDPPESEGDAQTG